MQESDREERDKAIIRLYSSGRVTLQQCADEHGITRERVRQILQQHKIKKRAKSAVRLLREYKDVFDFYLTGAEYEDCASKFTLTRSQVQKIVREWFSQLSLKSQIELKNVRDINILRKRLSRLSRYGDDECWVWRGKVNPVTGYGRAKYCGKWIGAHVACWQVANKRRTTMHILHSCDNPPCVNPKHMREGTPADNMADREARRRRKVTE